MSSTPKLMWVAHISPFSCFLPERAAGDILCMLVPQNGLQVIMLDARSGRDPTYPSIGKPWHDEVGLGEIGGFDFFGNVDDVGDVGDVGYVGSVVFMVILVM